MVEENCGRELYFIVGDCFFWFLLYGVVCVCLVYVI